LGDLAKPGCQSPRLRTRTQAKKAKACFADFGVNKFLDILLFSLDN